MIFWILHVQLSFFCSSIVPETGEVVADISGGYTSCVGAIEEDCHFILKKKL